MQLYLMLIRMRNVVGGNAGKIHFGIRKHFFLLINPKRLLLK